MSSSRFRHSAVAGATPAARPDHTPEQGGITLMPERDDLHLFTDAVESSGGRIVPLGSDTRAIMWLSNSDPDGLIDALEANPQVQWVQLPWAGVDAFSQALSDHKRDDLVWTSAKGAYSQPVAEHALTLLLAGLRSLGRRAHERSWGESYAESLFGRNVVVVGAGGIAVELIRLMQPFGVHVTVVRRSEHPVENAERVVTSDRLDEVLPDADAIVLAAASTDGTRHLVGRDQLDLLPEHAVLVNIARGPLVDTDALVDALAEKRILFAGLDVTDPEPLPDGHPLWDEERAIITSHNADTAEMTAPLLAERIRVNVEAYLGDGRFVGLVDPEAGY